MVLEANDDGIQIAEVNNITAMAEAIIFFKRFIIFLTFKCEEKTLLSILMLSYSKSKVYVKNLMSFYVWISPIAYSSKFLMLSKHKMMCFLCFEYPQTSRSPLRNEYTLRGNNIRLLLIRNALQDYMNLQIFSACRLR